MVAVYTCFKYTLSPPRIYLYNLNLFLKCISKRSKKDAIWKHLKFWNFSHIFSNSEVHLTKSFLIYVFVFWLGSILEGDFQNWCIYSETQEHFKWTFNIDVFIFKLWRILEVDFLDLCIFVETQKYTWKRLFKLMYLFANPEVYLN